MKRIMRAAAVAAVMTVGVAGPAQATYPVIDVKAIVQLKQQLSAMARELDQLRATHGALTGVRGMQNLLAVPTEERNYLPGDWQEMERVLAGQSARYGELARAVEGGVTANVVLSSAFLADRSPQEQVAIEQSRRRAAWLAATTRAAYAQTSTRFGELQQLIAAVGRVADAKAAADLQARIATEQAMLANEQAKLELLAQMAAAQEAIEAQQRREAALAGHGTFAARFQPTLR